MARAWHGGCETGAMAANSDPDGFFTSTVTRDTGTKRTGAASWKCDSGAGNAASHFGKQTTRGSSVTWYSRGYMCFAALPGSTVAVHTVGGAVSARLTSGGKLQFWDDSAGTQFGSDSAATISADSTTWYRIEIKVVLNASTQVTSCELRLDGTTVATGSSLTIACSVNNDFGWNAAPGANKVCWVDDVAYNDSTTAVNNTWAGDGRVVLLKPATDNARVGWTNGAGGTTNLCNDVNNTPPVGVASPASQPSQIKRAVANTTDTYDANLTDYTTAGIAANDTINAIQIYMNFGYSANFANSMGMEMLSNPAISEFTASGAATAVGIYPSNWTWAFKTSEYTGTASSNVTVGTAPVLRVRKNTSHASRIQFVDAMFAYVEYTPAAAIPHSLPLPQPSNFQNPAVF